MKDFLVSVVAFIISVGVHNPLAGARANARGQGQRQGQACGQGGLRPGGICLDLSFWVFWMGSVYQDRTLTIIIWSLLISSDLFWQVFWVPLNDLPVTLVSLLVLPTKLHLYAWVYTLYICVQIIWSQKTLALSLRPHIKKKKALLPKRLEQSRFCFCGHESRHKKNTHKFRRL